MYAVDLHSHSRFFHAWPGAVTPYDPVGLRAHAAAARLRGIDAMAVTNHDYAFPAEPTRVGGVTFLPGIEVSTSDGHVLVVGPDPPDRTEYGALTAPETVDLAHERGCVAVLAHPFRGSEARKTDADFDAVEINGKNPEHNDRVRALAEDRGLPIVGGSDAHYPPEVARMYTRVDCEELTPGAVADAVREGRTAGVEQFNHVDTALSKVYTAVHKLRGKM